MAFQVVKQLKTIDAMEFLTKPNCNLCMEEHLTIIKNPREKCVTVMNKNLEIYGAFRHKTTFHRFPPSTDDPILTGERVRPLKSFKILRFEFVNDNF